MESNRGEYEDAKYTQDGRMLSVDQLDQLEGVDGVDQLDESLDAFANVGQGLDGEHRTEMLNYWQQAIDEIEHIAEDGNGHDCFKSTALPLARIKKVMKTDSEVRMISAEAPILFAKGCDIFITELTMRAWIHAEENKRRTLQRSDIATAIQKSDVFDFLIDIVPREEAQQRKSSHHRPPHSEGSTSSADVNAAQQANPREVHYVGYSRNMNMGGPSAGPVNSTMHNMNMGNVSVPPGFHAGAGNANGMPSNIPNGVVSEDGLPPQQFGQYDNRFAQFQPQQFNGSGPQPMQQLPQFAQFPQFGNQFVPQVPGSIPQSLTAPPNVQNNSPGSVVMANQPQQPPAVLTQQLPQQPLPQQQMQQQPPVDNSQVEKDQIGRPASTAEASKQSPIEQTSQEQQQQEPEQQPQQPQQSQQPSQQQDQQQRSHTSPGSAPSPNLNQKAREQPRYDSEFQYASYGDPVDVTFGPSY